MKRALRLAGNLTLPADVATSTALIVGKRGSGKSNTATVIVEQLFHVGVPFVVLDPIKDDWWGLKASANGKGTGLAVYIFGGRGADLPLEPGAGALIADTLVEHRISAVLSLRHLTQKERSVFVADFAKRLLRINTLPLAVVLEEAHELAPQNPAKADRELEMLGAVTRLSKLGRGLGLGVFAVTQRPASLSKNVTTQSEILVAHRTIGPQDVKAIGDWIKYHGERADVLGRLSTLRTGEAIVWGPDFPEHNPIGLKQVVVARRETFDSAATPKVGERIVAPRKMAPVDLERLRTKMAATLERARAEDPVELKKTIASLQRQLQAAERSAADAVRKTAQKVSEIKVPVLDAKSLGQLERAVASANKAGTLIAAAADAVVKRMAEMVAKPAQSLPSRSVAPSVHVKVGPAHVSKVPAPKLTTAHSGTLPEPWRRIINSLGWWASVGITQPTRHQTAFGAIYTVNGHFNNCVGKMLGAGLISYPEAGKITLTPLGADRVEPDVVVSTAGDDLVTRVRSVIRGEPAQRVFNALVRAGGEISREDLAIASNYTVNGHFNNTLGALKGIDVVRYPSRGTVALGTMFDGVQ